MDEYSTQVELMCNAGIHVVLYRSLYRMNIWLTVPIFGDTIMVVV